MKSFIRSIQEPPFRQGCDQQSFTFSEQILPAGYGGWGVIQYYRTKKPTLNMYLPQMWLSACQFNNYSSEVQHVTHICNQNNNQDICSTNFCLLSSNHINKPAPGLLKMWFYFMRQLITSDSSGSKCDWMIMCSACCCLRECINAVALVLVSSGQELGTELIKDFYWQI